MTSLSGQETNRYMPWADMAKVREMKAVWSDFAMSFHQPECKHVDGPDDYGTFEDAVVTHLLAPCLVCWRGEMSAGRLFKVSMALLRESRDA